MTDKYRKALKNYTTSIAVSKTLTEIQQILLDFGAKGIGFEYTDNGRIKGIFFKIELNDNDRLVNVPSRVENVIKVLKEQKYYRDDDHAYRVAMRNIKDWLDAQMAMLATKMVEFPEIFLPYMVSPSGKTLYEVVKTNNYLLPGPKSGPQLKKCKHDNTIK